MRFLLLLVVFTTLYMGFLWNTRVIDYDEGVYAEVSREMFVNHEYILPTLNGDGFFEKPPVLYWGQMLGYRLFGTNTLGARFINALAGIASVLLLFLASRRPLGSATAFKASLILGTSIFFVYLSRIAMTDMLLTFFFMLCLCFSWWGVERALEGGKGAPLFWIGCAFAGLAMLTKGAIGAFLPFVTAFFYLLSIHRLRLLFKRSWFIPGTIILLTIGFSWYLLLGFAHPDGFAFMRDLFMKQHIERFANPLEGHSGPIYFYLIVLLVGFMPWSGFLPFAAFRCPYLDSSSKRVRFIRLFLFFSLITVVFFSIAATKLPNYICPALPGIAILTATLFDEQEKTKKWAWSIATYTSALLILGLGILFLALPQIIAHLPEWLGDSALKAPVLAQPLHLGFMPYACGLIIVAIALGLISVNRRQSTRSLFTVLSTATLIVISVLLFVVLPTYDNLVNRPLTRLAELAAAKTPEDGRIIMFEVSSRPSVNFYSQRKTLNTGLNNLETLKKNFQNPENEVGITTQYYLEKLKSNHIPTETILSDHGYVLFRIPKEQT